MQWKEVLIGAAVTLVVTVIGGLLVYSFTQDKSMPKSEVLIYQIDKQVSFDGSDNKLAIGAIKFANMGTEPASNVTAVFQADSSSIKEFKITSAGGAEVKKEFKRGKNSVTLSLSTLLPGEVISVTYLLGEESYIQFSLRSNRTMGKEGEIVRIEKSSKTSVNRFLGDFLPLLILIAVLPLFLIVRYLRKYSRGNCRNNIGFVLLHKNLIDDAKKILRSALDNGEDGVHALANYAAAIALSGDPINAKQYIESAIFLSRSKQETAICDFNQSIIEHIAGNYDGSVSSISKAIEKSKKEILSYIRNSEIFTRMLTENNKLKSLVDGA